MPVLDQIAYFKNRRDEVPNQELARELAKTHNTKGVQEIARNLWNKNRNVQSDCLKVLYEIGYLDPDLIADHVHDFIELLESKSNRMVWGAMIALATIAEKRANDIWESLDKITDAMEHGTLITVVWGVKTLAGVASTNKPYRERIFPILLSYLKTCIPRDVPTHAEHMLGAVDETNPEEFRSVLTSRQNEMTPPQLVRLKKVLKKIDTRL